MKKSMVFIFAILLLHWISLPSDGAYRPGRLRTGKGLRSPLTPPSQEGTKPGYFKVAEDIDLYHFKSGSGKPALVIHGGPGFPPTSPWEGLETLTGQFQFIYYHQRGCGLSTRPIDTFPAQNFMKNAAILDHVLGMSSQLADIERIRRIMGQEELILIGHSYGGFLATLYALEFPEHVDKMILIAPAGVLKMPVEEGEGFDKIKDHMSDKQRAEFDDFLSRYFDYGKIFTQSEADLRTLNTEYIQHFEAAMRAQGLDLPPGTKQNPALAGGWMVHALYLSLGMKYDFREELKKIRMPVLVLHGERDMMPVQASQEYADLLPAGKIRMIPKATHFPFMETPDEFSRLAKSFLEE